MPKILKYQDIIEMANILAERGFGGYDLKIVTEAPSRESFNKLNEDFFYRSTNGEKERELGEFDEISVKYNGFDFVYKIADNKE